MRIRATNRLLRLLFITSRSRISTLYSWLLMRQAVVHSITLKEEWRLWIASWPDWFCSYGSHLDNSGKTTDAELEKKNFEHAGSTLAEVWNSVIVNAHPIVAEYIDPLTSGLNDELHLNVADQNWFSEHVRTSQYFLQIVKCNNLSCCTAPRSSYFSIVPSQFFPGPVPLYQTLESGLRATERSNFEKHSFPSLFLSLNLSRELLTRSTRRFKSLPYDLYNPSVQSQLTERICKHCSLYFASKVMLNTHMRIHKNEKKAQVDNHWISSGSKQYFSSLAQLLYWWSLC